jgi:ATP-dependent Clp protease ATP-binding subunit ClpA
MGARPLRRALQQIVMTKAADFILQQTLRGGLNPNTVLFADAREGQIAISAKGQASA